MKKLNILQVNTGRVWGGAEVHMRDLSKELQKRGHRIIIACKKNRIVEEKLANEGLLVEHISSGIAGLISLLKIIRKEKIDVVHAHSGKDFGLAIMAAKLSRKVKVVLTRHMAIPMKNNLFKSFLNKKVDKFIAVSQATLESLINYNKIEKEKIILIHNGIDLNKYSSTYKQNILKEEYKISAEIKLIGCVGRLDKAKGQQELIKAIPMIIKKLPYVRFILIGDDCADGEKARLEDLIKKLELEPFVIFAGFRNDIAQVMHDLDIFILPSQQEAFPLVILEAMAQKKPVIATQVGGVGEIIKNKENGMLIEAKNTIAISKAIIYLLENKDEAQRMGQDGYQLVSKNFNLEQMVKKIETVYSS